MRSRLTTWLVLSWVCGTGAALSAQEIAVTPNLTYTTVGDVKLQLDLAVPSGEGPFPGIVFIHGGGWSGGNRHAFRDKIRQAADRGYVAATISYRLTQPDSKTGVGKTPTPAQIHDCKAAVRWLREHAAEYKLDPKRIAAAGASAGGHLSLMLGLTDGDDGLEGSVADNAPSSRVQAVVNIFGPTDLAKLYREVPATVGFFKAFCLGSPDEYPENYKLSSPIHYVTADDPPILTLHGDKDELVPVSQAKLLDEALQAAGVVHQLKVLAGQGHGFGGEAATDADDAFWAFLDEHLKTP